MPINSHTPTTEPCWNTSRFDSYSGNPLATETRHHARGSLIIPDLDIAASKGTEEWKDCLCAGMGCSFYGDILCEGRNRVTFLYGPIWERCSALVWTDSLPLECEEAKEVMILPRAVGWKKYQEMQKSFHPPWRNTLTVLYEAASLCKLHSKPTAFVPYILKKGEVKMLNVWGLLSPNCPLKTPTVSMLSFIR